jgi:peptide/nickel transport system permease protein
MVSFSDLSRRYTRRYIVKRISTLFVALFAVLVLNFILPRLMPGNFLTLYVESLERQHPGVNAKAIAARVEALYGLNVPLYDQFFHYLREILSFDPNFGPSFQYYPMNAWTVVVYAVKWTLLLLGSSQAVSWLLGVLIGIVMAFKKGKILDKALQPAFYFLSTIPLFWIGLMFILVFAVYFKVLPPSGAYGVHPTVFSVLSHLVLPLTVIVIGTLPTHALVIRGAALEVLSSDFVQAAKTQGLRKTSFLSMVLKNSLLPSLTQLFLSIGYLIGGIYTVEVTFSYPGMGSVIYNAISAQDYPVIQAALYLTTLVVILANLAADLLYPLVDPRVSYV